MIFRLFQQRPRADTIARLYGAIVAQARRPAFYREYRLPDTLDGRFELVLLHTVLVVRRLGRTPLGRTVGQAVFDHFCADMDASMRELGVGDLAVPRRMRRVGQAFYERQAMLEQAFADPSVMSALLQTGFTAGPEIAPAARRLAAYITETARVLDGQADERLVQGEVGFPDPLEAGAVPA